MCSGRKKEKQAINGGIMKKNVFRFITVCSAGGSYFNQGAENVIISLHPLFLTVIFILLPYFIPDIKKKREKKKWRADNIPFRRTVSNQSNNHEIRDRFDTMSYCSAPETTCKHPIIVGHVSYLTSMIVDVFRIYRIASKRIWCKDYHFVIILVYINSFTNSFIELFLNLRSFGSSFRSGSETRRGLVRLVKNLHFDAKNYSHLVPELSNETGIVRNRLRERRKHYRRL